MELIRLRSPRRAAASGHGWSTWLRRRYRLTAFSFTAPSASVFPTMSRPMRPARAPATLRRFACCSTGRRRFRFKGAALAEVATMFSAALQGAPLDHELMRMVDGDVSTPREMGHFFLAVDPARFAGLDVFVAAMARYLMRFAPSRAALANILSRLATGSGWLRLSVYAAELRSTRTQPNSGSRQISSAVRRAIRRICRAGSAARTGRRQRALSIFSCFTDWSRGDGGRRMTSITSLLAEARPAVSSPASLHNSMALAFWC